jgi:hypothetical protein
VRAEFHQALAADLVGAGFDRATHRYLFYQRAKVSGASL